MTAPGAASLEFTCQENTTISPDISPALLALREATRPLHVILDEGSPLTAPELDDAAYLAHAARVYGWMQPLEFALYRAPANWQWPARMQSHRRAQKSFWLEQDLEAGGQSPTDIPLCPYSPVAGSLAAAFGLAYVCEGATLGGAYLNKQLRTRLGLPLHWLRGYEADTGTLWREFQTVLATEVTTPSAIQGACESACAAFRTFHQWVIKDAQPLDILA